MNTSNHVDVVVGEGEPVVRCRDLADVLGDPVESVDVAPDPTRRIIVLAPTKQAGQEHADALHLDPVAIITPRSPYGARGLVADEIVEADGLSTDELHALMIEAAPALATSGGD
ncbi:hypothetical protein [Microbacterium sp. NPDC055599]